MHLTIQEYISNFIPRFADLTLNPETELVELPKRPTRLRIGLA
jgi:hypothetical protein